MNYVIHIERLKDKNNLTILIDAVNTFDKIQHPFLIKSVEGNILNLINDMYKKDPQMVS